jgi:cholera toxin transcriptional activator
MGDDVIAGRQTCLYRFGVFEADASTGELRRQGVRIKLNAQPFQVLCLLLDRPGELLSREEISRGLWPDGTFVDFEHGVNSAINRIREALGDAAATPRFIETLARRGYRFIAPVQRVPADRIQDRIAEPNPASTLPTREPAISQVTPPLAERSPFSGILSSQHELPRVSHPVVQTLFVLFQLMYLGFYVGALANLAEIDDLLSPLHYATAIFDLMIVTAAVLIPVRAFLICAVVFRAPAARAKLLSLWPFLLIFDVVWALSPFLLMHHINFGLALACTTLLIYSPFVQRSLVLMGAGDTAKPRDPALETKK